MVNDISGNLTYIKVLNLYQELKLTKKCDPVPEKDQTNNEKEK